jgi:hypothetical protein
MIQTTKAEIYIFTMRTLYKISSRALLPSSFRTGIFAVKCHCPETFLSPDSARTPSFLYILSGPLHSSLDSYISFTLPWQFRYLRIWLLRLFDYKTISGLRALSCCRCCRSCRSRGGEAVSTSYSKESPLSSDLIWNAPSQSSGCHASNSFGIN